jgi:DNA-binding beta-propeller fold protein YncE
MVRGTRETVHIKRLLFAIAFLSATCFAARLRQVAIVDLPGQPGFDTVAIANGALLVAHSAADTVDIFDLTKRRIIAQVKHVRGASGIAVDDKDARVFLSSPDAHSIIVISSKTWDVDGVIPVKSEVEHILYVPENNRLYLANSRDQSIAYIELADKNSVHDLDAGGMPERLAFDPAKKLIYATLQDKHSVAAYDLDLKPVSQWVLKASQPTGMTLDASSRRLYVAVRFAIITLDADSGAELSRAGAPSGVDALWLDRSSGTLYAAAGGTVCIMKTRDGGLTPESELNVDVKGRSLAYDSNTKLIYFPGGREGRSKLLIMREVENNAVAFKAKHGKSSAEGQ